MNALTESWLAVLALLAAASACTASWRWIRPPAAGLANGWALIGGVVAGLLLGPGVFGRVLPATFEAWYVGGVQQRIDRDRIIRRHGADALVAERVGLDREESLSIAIRQETELVNATNAWREAQWHHQRILRSCSLAVIGITFLVAGFLAVGPGDRRQGVLAPLSIGVWACIVPAAAAYAALTSWWNFSPAQAALAAGALGIGPLMLTDIDRVAADQVEFGGARMIQNAGRVASVIALVAIGWVVWSEYGIDRAMLIAPVLALPVGWMAGRLVPPRSPTATDQFARRAVRYAVEFILLPWLAACAAVKIDVREHFDPWIIIVILVLSDDGRWIGGFIGAMLLGGRRPLRTTRLVLGVMSAGPTQLAVAVLAVHLAALPEKLVLPLLLGSVLIELTAPMRRVLAERLMHAETQFNHPDGD